jgi:hypothetical protein
MTAATIDEITISGDPARWATLGFTVADGTMWLGHVRVLFGGHTSGDGLLRWSLRGLAGTDLDGLPTTVSKQPPPEAGPGEHPNGVSAIDHIVVVSPDLWRTVGALQRAGLDLRRIREEPTATGAPRQAFFRLGREILEVIQEPDEAIARGDDHDRPARFWGLALRTDNIDRAAQVFGANVSPIRPAVQPGRRIATVARSAGLPVPVALISPPPAT